MMAIQGGGQGGRERAYVSGRAGVGRGGRGGIPAAGRQPKTETLRVDDTHSVPIRHASLGLHPDARYATRSSFVRPGAALARTSTHRRANAMPVPGAGEENGRRVSRVVDTHCVDTTTGAIERNVSVRKLLPDAVVQVWRVGLTPPGWSGGEKQGWVD